VVEIINCDEWKNNVQPNPDGFQFEIKCLKCKSKDVQIITENNIGYSELTGLWGSVDMVIKCKDCGNAYSIEVEQ